MNGRVSLDNISVVIRATLLLMRTPDEMRGRIATMNALFSRRIKLAKG
ncbi:MAG TPA: hypothetical protein VHV10_12670 [Ktedonobacteraceae bacterium]|jgi:hypothetical protein|nr:hypothetical protein [Ktedonobacteraceae bacterium]